MRSGRRYRFFYAVSASTVIAAALAFLQVVPEFTPSNFSLFFGNAAAFAIVCAPFGAMSGAIAGSVVLILTRKRRTGEVSRRRNLVLVAVGLTVGSIPGFAFAVWATGQVDLDVKYPSQLQWIEFSVALVLLVAGGVLFAWRSDVRSSAAEVTDGTDSI